MRQNPFRLEVGIYTSGVYVYVYVYVYVQKLLIFIYYESTRPLGFLTKQEIARIGFVLF